MTTYIDTKIVCLTSQSATVKRNDSFLSNVRYNLGVILKNDNDIIHRQVQLLNAQIPYSFYVINYTNNLFRTDLLGSIVTYTIPVGNYNSSNLITAIKTALGNPAGFSISISSSNGKLTFTYTSNFTIYNNFQYSIGTVLGFSSNSTNTSVANNLTCSYPLNLLGIKTLQIRSGNLIMNNISSIEGGQTILLSSVPVSAVPFGMIDYTDKGNLITIYNTDLDDLDIDIIDGESGEYINFNNQDWCITLAFHTTRVLEGLDKTAFPKVNLPEINLEKNTELSKKEKPINKDLEELNILSS